MEKKIGYELVINNLNGFSDARGWINRLIRAGVVKCTRCAQPATHVYWQDQAEWYPHCPADYDSGDQWTGSTSWNPTSFGLRIISREAGETYLATLDEYERKDIQLTSFDATNYHDWIDDTGMTRHFLEGDTTTDYSVWLEIIPLINGEYVYEVNTRQGRATTSSGIKGVWTTREAALEAAKTDWRGEGVTE